MTRSPICVSPHRPVRKPGKTFVLALLLVAQIPAQAFAGDAGAGKDVFKTECAECHSLQEGRQKKGPSLFGVVGRKAASLPDYDYSSALRGQGGWVWTPEQLHTYLSQPAAKADPGTKMKYDGLDDAKQLDDLISYLSTIH